MLFRSIVISTIISVGLCEFLGRAFETAKKDDNKKKFNYETHTYDSEKNGKLNADGSKAYTVESGKNKKLTTSNSKKAKAK